jgi:aspartyl-tRNA(Asn)/glutamyl-tRNA(Gln) amidotransferase subunit A
MAIPTGDVFYSTVTELHQRLVAGEFSAVELARAFGERLEKVGPRYNALALSLREEAVRAAKDVDRELKRGRTRTPLQGVPGGVIDLLSVAGRPTTWGAEPFAGQVFPEDAAAVTRLRKAGAGVLGKLSTVALAGGVEPETAVASLQGPGLNPWDRQRWTGGASSGPAAAVAAGVVPFALGFESNGTLVRPCALCGVTGLRPTYGLVSRRGAMGLSWSMDKVGVVARTAEDCGHVLAAISGGDDDDAGSSGKSFHFSMEFSRPLEQVRFGFSSRDFGERLAAELRAPLQAALGVLKGCGGKWSEVALPDLPYEAVASTIVGAEAASAFEDDLAAGRLQGMGDARQVAGLRAGLAIPAAEYLRAMRVRRLVMEAMGKLWSDVDVLVSPTTGEVAGRVSEARAPQVGSSTPMQIAGISALISAGNLAGLPCLTLPAGFVNGLPVGISLTGMGLSENTLIKAGMYYQSKTEWHRSRPPGQPG